MTAGWSHMFTDRDAEFSQVLVVRTEFILSRWFMLHSNNVRIMGITTLEQL